VTNERHGLFRRKHVFNERQRIAVAGQVPKRAVASREKHGVIVCVVDFRQLCGVGERIYCGRVLFKASRIVGLEGWLAALRIERRLTTLRRSERDVGPGVTKNEIGCSEFLKPESRLSSGVSQLIV
jgi:hypothetical protein